MHGYQQKKAYGFPRQEWQQEQAKGLGTQGAAETQIKYSWFTVSSTIGLWKHWAPLSQKAGAQSDSVREF